MHSSHLVNFRGVLLYLDHVHLGLASGEESKSGGEICAEIRRQVGKLKCVESEKALAQKRRSERDRNGEADLHTLDTHTWFGAEEAGVRTFVSK
jgi:hypothetical protein